MGDPGFIPGSGRSPRRREWQPTPVFLPEESHGQRSLVGYSPQGHKELDTTERLTLSHFMAQVTFQQRGRPMATWNHVIKTIISENRLPPSPACSPFFLSLFQLWAKPGELGVGSLGRESTSSPGLQASSTNLSFPSPNIHHSALDSSFLGDSFLKILFIYFSFLALLGLCCCKSFSLVSENRGYSLVVVSGFSLLWLLRRAWAPGHMSFSSRSMQAQ